MYNSIDINDITDLIGKVEIIDVRTKEEYQNGFIPSAKNIDMFGLLMNPTFLLDKNKTYYLYCEHGMRSANVAEKLSQQGYNIINLLGGYSAYKNK